MPITDNICLTLWYRALGTEIGIAVETDEKRILENQLYRVRKEAKNPDLDAIIIIRPGRYPNELWLMKKQQEGM